MVSKKLIHRWCHHRHFFLLYYIKQIDTMWVCSVTAKLQISVTHSAESCVPLFLFLPHFDVNCALSLNRRTVKWNLLVELSNCLWVSICEMSLKIKTQDCNFSCVVGLMDDACEVLCCTATKKIPSLDDAVARWHVCSLSFTNLHFIFVKYD